MVVLLYGSRVWFVVVVFYHVVNAHAGVADAAVRIRRAYEDESVAAGDDVVVVIEQLPLTPVVGVVGVVDSAGMWLRLAVVFLCCRYRWWV